jgi:hypothetical protein
MRVLKSEIRNFRLELRSRDPKFEMEERPSDVSFRIPHLDERPSDVSFRISHSPFRIRNAVMSAEVNEGNNPLRRCKDEDSGPHPR